jgi:hypothetical protein
MKLYKYCKLNKHTFDLLKNQTLYLATHDQLNDPFDGFLVIDSDTNYASLADPNVRVCSLTTNENDFKMWSYYNDHNGICIEFELDDETDLYEVIYEPYAVNIEDFDNNRKECTFNAFRYKSEDFANENEYRIIKRCDQNDTQSRFYSVRNKIKSITVGMNAFKDLNNMYSLIKVLKELDYDYKLIRVKHSPSKRKIETSKTTIEQLGYHLHPDFREYKSKMLELLKGTQFSRSDVERHLEELQIDFKALLATKNPS